VTQGQSCSSLGRKQWTQKERQWSLFPVKSDVVTEEDIPQAPPVPACGKRTPATAPLQWQCSAPLGDRRSNIWRRYKPQVRCQLLCRRPDHHRGGALWTVTASSTQGESEGRKSNWGTDTDAEYAAFKGVVRRHTVTCRESCQVYGISIVTEVKTVPSDHIFPGVV